MTRHEAHEPSRALCECGSLPAVAGLSALTFRQEAYQPSQTLWECGSLLPLWVRPFPYPNLNEVAAALREGCKFVR